jgi:hypothetical protein
MLRRGKGDIAVWLWERVGSRALPASAFERETSFAILLGILTGAVVTKRAQIDQDQIDKYLEYSFSSLRAKNPYMG